MNPKRLKKIQKVAKDLDQTLKDQLATYGSVRESLMRDGFEFGGEVIVTGCRRMSVYCKNGITVQVVKETI